MKKYLLPLILLAAPAFAAQQEITAVPDSPVLPSIGALKDAVNLRLADIDENFDEIYPIIEAGPVYVNASAPADTKVVWIDTDQSNTIKVYIGGVWTAVGTAGEGSYTLPTAAADTLGGVKVGARLTITDGVLSADVQTGDGDDLGSAAYTDVVALWTTCTGYLKSDGTCDTPSGSATYPSAAGVASWNGSAWGTSYTVGTAADNLVQLNASAQLPAVSADLLTITDNNTYFTTDTVGAALNQLGSELAGVTEITIGTGLTDTNGTLSVTYPVTSAAYGSGWSDDTDGAQRDDIYAILHAGDTDDDGKADVLDSVVSAEEIRATGIITGLMQPVVIATAEGADDTSTDAAFLTDSGETWPTNAYVGMTLYNVTDGSSCVVTANTATTMTCTLAGGTDNDWDSADVWAVAPGPKQSGSMFYIGSATTILHPAIAGYGVCYMTTGANAVSVDPQSASMALYLNGATIGDGDEIDIPNTAGNYACLHNKSTTIGYVLGTKGTIADGGAD